MAAPVIMRDSKNEVKEIIIKALIYLLYKERAHFDPEAYGNGHNEINYINGLIERMEKFLK